MAKGNATIDLNALRIAGEGATGYITQITDGGIRVHDKNDEDNFVQITNSNMQIYKDNVSIANFGDIVQIGKVESANATFGSDYFALKNEKSVPVLLYESSEATTTESAKEVVQQVGMHGFLYTIQGTPLDNQPINVAVMIRLGATSIIRNTVSFTAGTSNTIQETNPISYSVVYNATNNTIAIATSGQYVVGINYIEYLVSTSAPTLSFGTTNPMDDPISKGAFSSSFGQGLTAFGDNQTVIGKYNRNDENNEYAFIIGNGDGWINTTLWTGNALTVDWSGNAILAGNLTMKGHDSPIGDVIAGTETTKSNSATATWVEGSSVNLSNGIWVITAHVNFAQNTSGRRAIAIYSGTAQMTPSLINQSPTSGAITHMVTTYILSTSGSTVSVRHYQNSGGTLSATSVIRAVRIR